MLRKNIKLSVVIIGVIINVIFFVNLTKGAEKQTNKEAKVVTEGKTVKVNYTLTVDGKIIDSSKEGEPFEFRTGSNQVIPGFEEGIMGMKVGEKKSFQVSPEKGYGNEDPKGIQKVPRDKFPPNINPEVGMTLYAKMPNGKSIPARIIEVNTDAVILNFNHPLSGKTLNFEVEIVEIK